MPDVPWRRDDRWLSLTPEPERLLPEARAILRSGHGAAARASSSSGERGSRSAISCGAPRALGRLAARDARRWPTRRTDETESAGALVRDVVANHDALALGLPGAERLH